MTGDNLPDAHHIVRYVKPSLVEGETIDGSAFLLRPEEIGLSVNWLEVFAGNDEHYHLNEVRRLSRLKLVKNGRFAKLNVGETKQYVSESVEKLGTGWGIVEAPLPPTGEFEADPSHTKIIGLPSGESDEAMLIGDLIADCVIYPLHPGRTD